MKSYTKKLSNKENPLKSNDFKELINENLKIENK
jgi:hypothetical protein